MVFYHGTTEDNWKKIQNEGVLWGRRGIIQDDGSIKEVDRCTYLAIEKEEAKEYGDILLQVEYNPFKSIHNNYKEGSWQIRVYEPISITNISKLEE